MIRLFSLAIAGASLATAANAQTDTTSGSMPANTLITVTPMAEITSKHLEVGQAVDFVTVGDVAEAGKVVIPRGSLVKGDITFKTGKAIGGKSGKFEVSFRTVQVHGKSYALKGMHRQEGKGNTVAAVFGSMLVSGRSAVMQPGQEARAFTAEPIPYGTPVAATAVTPTAVPAQAVVNTSVKCVTCQ